MSSLYGSSYHDAHSAESARRAQDAAEAPRLRRERDELAETLEEFHRYALVPGDGYSGSPFEDKVRAQLERAGRRNLP